MRRKKDDRPKLRRGNGRNDKRNLRAPNFGFNRNNGRNAPIVQNEHKKRSGKTVLLMIIVLIAFIVGAGIGILMSFDDGSVDENVTHYKNVTKEMTTNVNKSGGVVFDEADQVDFNENESSKILGADQNPYYNRSSLVEDSEDY